MWFGGAVTDSLSCPELPRAALEGRAWRRDKISPAIEVLEIFGPSKLLSRLRFSSRLRQPNHTTKLPTAETPTQSCAMPSTLGKRKSRPVEEEPDSVADAQELLRRHFEARFKPLAVAARAAPNKPAAASGRKPARDDSQLDDDDSDSDADAGHSGSDWSGVSSEDDIEEDDEDEDDDDGMRAKA